MANPNNAFSAVNAIVALIDKDQKLGVDLNMFLNMKTGAELGSLPIALDLIRVAGLEQMTAMPYPGSIPPDKVGVKGWGNGKVSNLPDKYWDSGEEKVKSRWHDLCDQSALGKALIAEASTIKEGAEHADDKVEEGSKAARAVKRLTNLHLLTAKAGKIIHQLAAFNGAEKFGCMIGTQIERPVEFIFEMPDVPKGADVPWLNDGQKRYLTTSSMCIRVFGKRDNGKGGTDFHSEKYVSLGTFLGYDVAEALRVGGEVKHLYKTIKRDTQSPATQTARVKGVNDAVDYLREIAGWSKSQPGQDDYIALLNACNGKEGDQVVGIVGDVNELVGAVFEKVKHRYQRLVLNESERADAAADQTKGKAA